MQETVKGRLLAYIKHIGLNHFKFEKQCGLSNGYVANMRKSIQPDKLEKISKCFPELSTGWLMTGEGEMIRGEMNDKPLIDKETNADDVLMKALDEIGEQRKLVSRAQDQIDKLISITKTMAEAIQKLK